MHLSHFAWTWSKSGIRDQGIWTSSHSFFCTCIMCTCIRILLSYLSLVNFIQNTHNRYTIAYPMCVDLYTILPSTIIYHMCRHCAVIWTVTILSVTSALCKLIEMQYDYILMWSVLFHIHMPSKFTVITVLYTWIKELGPKISIANTGLFSFSHKTNPSSDPIGTQVIYVKLQMNTNYMVLWSIYRPHCRDMWWWLFQYEYIVLAV